MASRTMRLIDGGIAPSPATQSSFATQPATTTTAPATTKPAAQPATGGAATAAPAANLPATAGAAPAATTLPAVANASPATVNVTATGSVVGTTPANGAAGAGATTAAPMTLDQINAKIAAAERYASNMWQQGKVQQAAGAQTKLDEYYRLRNELSGTDPLQGVTIDPADPNQTSVPTPTEQQLDAAIANLLNPEFIGFQGDRAAELRRLQNLRNQLFGYKDAAGNVSVGSLGRQEQSDLQARRRLAAQRASSGMLQGGAYAGTERGLGTLQEADQAYGIQELLRPYQEQVASDRLQEFGLGYDPTGRNFDLLDFGNSNDIMGGWASGTFAGRRAAAAARNAAVQQLLQQGTTV
jgi:hypothetical protein